MAQRAVSRQDSTKISLTSAPDLALGKVYFFNFFKFFAECHPAWHAAKRVFKKKLKFFAECQPSCHSAKRLLCRASNADTRQIVFIFFSSYPHQTFSVVLIEYLVFHVPMWHISRTFSIFFNLFHLIEFSLIIQIITASHSNNEKMNGKMIFMLFSIM